MATDVSGAKRLVETVNESNRVFQVGHIFEYAEPVRQLRSWIGQNRLGRVKYITVNRASLGPRLRTDCNIVWDYAIHDLYMLMHLLEEIPQCVSARGIQTFYSQDRGYGFC